MTIKTKVEHYVRNHEVNKELSIGHQPHLEHYLKVLDSMGAYSVIDGHSPYCEIHITLDDDDNRMILFSLTTGQPATESDYQAFADLVGIK